MSIYYDYFTTLNALTKKQLEGMAFSLETNTSKYFDFLCFFVSMNSENVIAVQSSNPSQPVECNKEDVCVCIDINRKPLSLRFGHATVLFIDN